MSETTQQSAARLRPGRWAADVGIACGIVSLFALLWTLREVVLIAFGSIVFAVLIRAIATPLHRWLRMREGWTVALVVFCLVAGFFGLAWLFGRQIAQQMQGLTERLPRAVDEVRAWVESLPIGNFVMTRLSGFTDAGGSLAGLQKAAAVSAGTIGHALLMFFGGIFIAANPTLYLDGFVRLFPVGYRPTLHGALVQSGHALQKWLIGQFATMCCIGTMVGIGLRIAGAPLPLVLGIIAGLLNFIPIVGPLLSFIPGVLVAFTDSPRTAVAAALVYFIVQQLEGHVISPLIHRWAVRLPPAYGMLAVLSFALLFGIFGVLFGVPLAVVCMCLVQNLYIEGALEQPAAEQRRRNPKGSCRES